MMPFTGNGEGIRFFTFDIFDRAGILQGIFTRHGGVSEGVWASLNVGSTVGDDSTAVRENRSRTFSAIRRSLDTLFDVWQVHSKTVVVAERPRLPNEPHIQADAIITDKPGITLFMRFADCVPILMADPRKGVVGIAHAGWQGTVRQVTVQTIFTMQEKFQCNPEDIIAGIGPSIGPDHYQVKDDVIDALAAVYGEDIYRIIRHEGESVFLDLWEANAIQLRKGGVEHIEIARICTACNVKDWYSHRAEKGKTGRFGGMISLS